MQTLPSELQAQEVFKLLAVLSPLACEVSDVKDNISQLVGSQGEQLKRLHQRRIERVENERRSFNVTEENGKNEEATY